MRIRSIKPEFWRSPDISRLALEERLLFIGLWSYVDDNGVGEDRVATVAADLFADDLERDPPDTLARVTRGLLKLAEAGRIIRYDVAGRPFLEVVNWLTHQRIDKPARPRHPQHSAENAVIRDTLARSPEIFAPGTGEQGNRGTEEQGGAELENPASPPSPFCPRHQASGGTDQPCRGCKFAATDRERWEIAQLPPGVEYVHEHNWFPDGTCATCPERQF